MPKTMDNQSFAHNRYNYTYHIVFIPKYRRKVMFGKLRKDVGEILGKERRFRECNVSGIFFVGTNTKFRRVFYSAISKL